MFKFLGFKDLKVVVMAMQKEEVKTGEQVIKQGTDGDCIYVVESGNLDCTKTIDGQDNIVKKYSANEVFGELALLYNCQRAASIEAKSDCVLWKLDRDTFNHIVKDSARK